jgi:hypothetical protein
MIDNFSILLSTAMIVYIIVRAVRLTRTEPWFERIPPDELAQAASRRRGRQRDLRAELAAREAASQARNAARQPARRS